MIKNKKTKTLLWCGEPVLLTEERERVGRFDRGSTRCRRTVRRFEGEAPGGSRIYIREHANGWEAEIEYPNSGDYAEGHIGRTVKGALHALEKHEIGRFRELGKALRYEIAD